MKKILKYILISILSFFLISPNLLSASSFLPNDPHYLKQWYLERIKAPQAWEKINSSPNIIIAVIDTGVDIDHPDLKDNIWVNKGEVAGNRKDDDANGFIDDLNGWDFVENSADPRPKFDDNWTESGISHGTMVAGVIAAMGNNNLGISGITWDAQIMPLRALNSKGEGSVNSVVRAIDYAINNGADIINLSFVGFNYNQTLYEAVLRAHRAGVMVVAAAGNEKELGFAFDTDKVPIYPACFTNELGEPLVIGVAATDSLDQKADFSSYGFNCVDISAPGISFYSTIMKGSLLEKPLAQYDGYWSGTSLAAPLVSGALALIAELNPNLDHKELTKILLDSSDNISLLNPNYLGQLGAGRLNLDRAVQLAEESLYSKLTHLLISPASTKAKEAGLDITKRDGSRLDYWFLEEAAGAIFASGDLDGDGIEEIVLASPAGKMPYISIYSSKGELRSRFLAYHPDFKGGFSLAIADLDNDGLDEIIVGAGAGGGPHVRIFDHKANLKGQFFAFEENFRGGINVAAGNIDSYKGAEIVVVPQSNRGPEIKIFSAQGKLQGQFYAFDKNYRGGLEIAIANIDGRNDNGKSEIIVSPKKNHEPIVKIFTHRGILKDSFLVFNPRWQGGFSLAAADLDNDGKADIIVGAREGASPHVRIFSAKGALMESFYAYPEDSQLFNLGLNVSTINYLN